MHRFLFLPSGALLSALILAVQISPPHRRSPWSQAASLRREQTQADDPSMPRSPSMFQREMFAISACISRQLRKKRR